MYRSSRNQWISILLTIILTAVALALPPALGQAFGADAPDSPYDIQLQGQVLTVKGYLLDHEPYLPVSLIGSSLNNDAITVDTTNRTLRIDLSRLNLVMADESTAAFIRTYGGTATIPLRTIGGTLCFPLNDTEQLFHVTASVSGSTIRIRSFSSTAKVAKVSKPQLIATPTLSNEAQTPFTLSQGDAVYVLGTADHYYLVETIDGTPAYIKKEGITISEIDLGEVDLYAPRKKKFDPDGTISVAWQYFSSKSAVSHPTEKYAGLDILAPTWFDLIVNGDGSVSNHGDKGYTDAAHKLGYQVWATVTNSMSTAGSTAFTTAVFNNDAMLNRSVAQYLFYACLYDVDGINIDFEDVKDSDAAGLTAFTALMRYYTERQGLTLSIDTLIPRTWTMEYDRDQLAKYVDYLAVMTYDQHYSSSPVAGSVASLPWVEEAIQNTLKEVPASQVLLGVPLYTRVWTTDANNKLLSNSTATMTRVRDLLSLNQHTPIWRETEKQYYAEYPNGSNLTKIWIEDQRSISERLDLVQRYQLAGSASWQLNQGVPEIWEVYHQMLHQGAGKEMFQLPYR